MPGRSICRPEFKGGIEVYCPDPEQPFCAQLFPPPSQPLPPLIAHLRAPEQGEALTVSELVASATVLPASYVEQLIWFGAVYVIEHRGARPLRATTDRVVPPAHYLRVHVNPKRYLSTYTTDWPERIVHCDAELVVVDKPPGVPSQPLVDNTHECLPAQVERVLDLSPPGSTPHCFITSRLDVATSGLVVLGRTRTAASEYNKLIQARRLRKEYLLLCRGDHPLGEVRHRCRPNSYPRRSGRDFLLRRVTDAADGSGSDWVDAVLSITDKERRQDGTFQYRVLLITGRTHQIRLQFAALGSPVLDDTRYEGLAGVLDEDLAVGDSVALGPDPERIALQAAELGFEWWGEDRVFRAGPPWWVST